MPDDASLSSTPASVVIEPATSSAPAPPAGAEVTLSPREEIYARYNASQAGSVPATPVPQAEEVAPVVEVAAPPPPVPDAAPVPVTPSASESLMAQMAEMLSKTTAQLAAMEARETARNAPPPVIEPEVEPDFIAKLRDGDIKGAEAAMRDSIKAALLKEMGAAPDAGAIAREVQETMKLETEVGNFLTSLRSANPDVIALEAYIAPVVQAQMEVLKKGGSIKSNSDYVTAYKKACTDEFAKAKAILQTTRAAGKVEANTTSQTVLASSTITPSPVAVDRGIAAPVPGPPDVSTGSYLEKRLAASHRSQGLSN